jgi:hypothetical protein
MCCLFSATISVFRPVASRRFRWAQCSRVNIFFCFVGYSLNMELSKLHFEDHDSGEALTASIMSLPSSDRRERRVTCAQNETAWFPSSTPSHVYVLVEGRIEIRASATDGRYTRRYREIEGQLTYCGHSGGIGIVSLYLLAGSGGPGGKPGPTVAIAYPIPVNHLTARRHCYQIIIHPLWTRSQNRTTVGVRTTRQRSLYHDCPVWPCTHALHPCICRPPPRKPQRLSA